MRKILYVLLAVSVLAGCNKVENPGVPEQDATEQDGGTKALYGQLHSTLNLYYRSGDLVIDHENAMMNPCVLRGGVYYEITVENHVIEVVVHERMGLEPEPKCRIPHMTCTIPGLDTNQFYVLEYKYDGRSIEPVFFKFNSRLDRSIDLVEPGDRFIYQP